MCLHTGAFPPQWVEGRLAAKGGKRSLGLPCSLQMLTELRDALWQVGGFSSSAPRADAPHLVAQLENRYGLRLPDDFRFYLIEALGVEEWSDHVGIGWYPIERIASLSEIPSEELPGPNPEVLAEPDQYLVFADYLDWCGYGYAICCSEGARRGHVAMVHPSPGRFICRTFTTFVQLVAIDSRRLHSPAGDRFDDIP